MRFPLEYKDTFGISHRGAYDCITWMECASLACVFSATGVGNDYGNSGD